MRVTATGQVTIPPNLLESMGILPAETDIDFRQDESGRWYIETAPTASRFRTAHKIAPLAMSTEAIMALTRS
ncbi:AbrB family transcriptional regulator [Methylovulum psychrotolerans]|jgi:bifunctional DNA-binding transcriptional regulator/antitoxin component of YhaV-PrlF toxin-antitoxin module|uniref:AbrB family transcriptional regulator n=1 Tax=Methylovulum psychrotolerans TaxID=1704499 RepID=A0A1Z4C331_9GAMM|nr:AbrB family transcriptional regulator [Methylovulum psychrotolerans]ASF47938.1 AbrB family transcriptional regulator [Methylovulum psychrotolerans]